MEQIDHEHRELYNDMDSSTDTFIDEDINIDAAEELESDDICQDAERQLGSLGPTEDEPDPFEPSNDLMSQNICVILVAIVCNKPAAHKMGGFGSHSHTNLHTSCWITQADKDKARAFVKDSNLQSLSPLAFAPQYTQLSRLLYFNLVEQIMIDPMHNLFLSLVKTHFYNIWVQSKILWAGHELKVLHEMLANVSTYYCLNPANKVL
ncbi:hypothetical protein BS17DRAFT_694301 [Gyrodon lividus]|nr:hypothetical protein BS17DRAFT_694301 [Gyrodon lividus]